MPEGNTAKSNKSHSNNHKTQKTHRSTQKTGLTVIIDTGYDMVKN